MNENSRKMLAPDDVTMAEYSDLENIKKYSTVGLWNSEEILVDCYFERNSSVLDIGCGAGRTTIALARKGFYVTGIDLIPSMIKVALKQAAQYEVTVKLIVMDASLLSFSNESFQNVLFSFNGFEHINGKEKRDRLIREVYRVLRPGGFFILTARSGFAFGKRWIAWIWMFICHYLLKIFGIGNTYLELGDIISKNSYHHYLSPFKIRKDLLKNGFVFHLFNSHRNLERNKKQNFFTNFSSDKSLFFIAQKSSRGKI